MPLWSAGAVSLSRVGKSKANRNVHYTQQKHPVIISKRPVIREGAKGTPDQKTAFEKSLERESLQAEAAFVFLIAITLASFCW
jgi:hypothetical protein